MKVKRLTVVNFCNHRHRVLDFGDGTNVIIGANGSGKSNILGAISFALTGENPNVGTKNQNICDLAPTTETSYVELEFTHGSLQAVVRRNIRPARPTATLLINGVGPTLEGDVEVTARIEQILGVSVDIINSVIIVAQNDIFGFIDKKAAARAEQFQRLFGTEQAAVLYKMLTDYMKTLVVPTITGEPTAIQADLAAAQKALTDLNAQVAQLADHESIQQQRDLNMAIVRQFDEADRLHNQAVSLTNQLNAAQVTLTNTQATLTNYQSELATVQASLAGSTAAADAAKISLANIANIRQQQAQQTRAANYVSTVQCELARVRALEPVKPADYIADLQTLNTTITEIAAQLSKAEHLVNSLHDGVAACPVCNTPVTTLAAQISAARAAIPQLRQQQQALSAASHSSQTYNHAVLTWAMNVAQLEKQLAEANTRLNELQVAVLPQIDEATLQATVANTLTLQNGVGHYQRLIMETSTAKGRLEGQINTLTAQLGEINRQLGTLPRHTVETRTTAQHTVTQWDMVATERRRLELHIATTGVYAQHLEQQYSTLVNVMAQADKMRSVLSHLGALRDLFHKDAAPRFVAQRNLGRLEHVINSEVLPQFMAEFRVVADEGLSFIANFTNGSRQPAERLSGGQKVILAFAFRIALHLMFTEGIGALYLDEPTAWLDENNIKGFETAVTQLRQYAASRGLQVIIITHERALAPLFDTVIQL